MATKKPTQLVVSAGKSSGNIPVEIKTQLEARAARFGMAASSSPSPMDKDKLAARAARFADIKVTGAKSSSTTPNVVSSNPADAEMLAKRAARFADIKNTTTSNKTKTTLTTTTTTSTTTSMTTNPSSTTTSNIADAERLAKRAARFADIKAKASK